MFNGRKKEQAFYYLTVILGTIGIFTLLSCTDYTRKSLIYEQKTGLASSNVITVHYIYVGQGDATLIQGVNYTILIDAGRYNRNDVVPYLESVGVENIDLLVGTHPHADHIGQFEEILERFPVAKVWMSGDEHTTRTYRNTMKAISASEAGYYEPIAGDVFHFGKKTITIFNPPSEHSWSLNDGSIAMKVQYGEVKFLFTGDAERKAEHFMVESGYDLNAQILKMGHHGSRTSSTTLFLEAVDPEIAIFSAGVGNRYGHPHQEPIERVIRSTEALIYGTNYNNTIRIITDGIFYEVIPSTGKDLFRDNDEGNDAEESDEGEAA